MFYGSSGMALLYCLRREKLCTWCIPNYKGETFPFAFPKSTSEHLNIPFSFFFFPLIFLSVLIYANNPLAHSLQADLSLIFSRDWKLILLLLVQPVLLGGQLNFIVTELYTTYAMHIYKYVIQIFIAPCTVAHATGTSEAIFWCTTQYIIKINVSII